MLQMVAAQRQGCNIPSLKAANQEPEGCGCQDTADSVSQRLIAQSGSATGCGSAQTGLNCSQAPQLKSSSANKAGMLLFSCATWHAQGIAGKELQQRSASPVRAQRKAISTMTRPTLLRVALHAGGALNRRYQRWLTAANAVNAPGNGPRNARARASCPRPAINNMRLSDNISPCGEYILLCAALYALIDVVSRVH